MSDKQPALSRDEKVTVALAQLDILVRSWASSYDDPSELRSEGLVVIAEMLDYPARNWPLVVRVAIRNRWRDMARARTLHASLLRRRMRTIGRIPIDERTEPFDMEFPVRGWG